jgi:hypothetical protein
VKNKEYLWPICFMNVALAPTYDYVHSPGTLDSSTGAFQIMDSLDSDDEDLAKLREAVDDSTLRDVLYHTETKVESASTPRVPA